MWSGCVYERGVCECECVCERMGVCVSGRVRGCMSGCVNVCVSGCVRECVCERGVCERGYE